MTDLVSRVWRSGELDGDTLRFYAYAAGSGDLSLRVYYKESGSTANNGTRLLPSDDRNFSVRLTLNQSYIFSLYLYRDGRRIGDAAVYYVSYRARQTTISPRSAMRRPSSRRAATAGPIPSPCRR